MKRNDPCSFELVVRIHALPSGGADARHAFASAEDEAVAEALPSGGVYHIAHGLLLEALRREAHLSVLTEITKDPTYLASYATADLAGRQEIERVLAETMGAILQKGVAKLAPGAAKQVLTMLLEGAGVCNATPSE